MVKLKYIGLSICMIILMSVIAFSTPPRFWYGTYAVEDYEGNGCDDSLNCIYPHEHADGFHQGVQNHADSINFEYYQRDVEDDSCTADRWAGWYAETNYMDFLFYAGHGTGFGPKFGCDPEYEIDCWNDIRFHENGWLNWVQAAACRWFCPDSLGDGYSAKERWQYSFKGVHWVQGHRAQTYDHDYSDEMSDAFFEYWIMERDPAWHAWRDAQFDWIYNGGAKSGLIPATMAPDGRYAFEMYLSADGSDAPDGDDDNYLIWAEIGDPEYPPEL